ncbi:hypothetical protein FQA39_LY10315 [Lamprigera yunnana]|nr:hypothetical protein FQA39_LY10315 [Lamprigera yunnana]
MLTLSTDKRTTVDPNFIVNLDESGQISVAQFSPYEISQDLLLIAFPTKILLAQLMLKDNIELKNITEFNIGLTCTALVMSSETSLNTFPPNVVFCSASTDFKLRTFKSDLGNESYCQLLSGHTAYINEISYDPENNFIASVSDDSTARVWKIEDHSCVAVLLLTSPGMSTCWHREDSSKLMVAEKAGLIRFYNVNTQKQILSLEYSKPLSAAHWAPSNSQMVCSLHLGELAVWDLSHPSRPSHTKIIHTTNGGSIKINSFGELVASVNRLEGCAKVSLISSQQQRLMMPIKLATSATWHFRLPILCIPDDSKLCFWNIPSN